MDRKKLNVKIPAGVDTGLRLRVGGEGEGGVGGAPAGDLYVVLKEYVTPAAKPGAGYVAGHGSVWDYDRRVPILFVAKGLKPASPATAADTVDILPTVASWIGLAVPKDSVDGVCRSEAARCR